MLKQSFNFLNILCASIMTIVKICGFVRSKTEGCMMIVICSIGLEY